MEIQQFVSLDEVDPIFFETSYYSAAEESGKRAYNLLFRGMTREKLAAIARVTLSGREQVVLIRPYDEGLLLHTLYYPAEVREVGEYGHDTASEVPEARGCAGRKIHGIAARALYAGAVPRQLQGEGAGAD